VARDVKGAPAPPFAQTRQLAGVGGGGAEAHPTRHSNKGFGHAEPDQRGD